MAVWVGKNNLNCHKCNAQLQKVRGCTEPVAEARYMDGVTSNRCPLKVVNQQSITYLMIYNHYKAGFLPHEGGILQQPSKILDAIKVIESTIAEMEEKEK